MNPKKELLARIVWMVVSGYVFSQKVPSKGAKVRITNGSGASEGEGLGASGRLFWDLGLRIIEQFRPYAPNPSTALNPKPAVL